MKDEKQTFERKCSRASCRSCGHFGLKPILDLGQMPLSDGFLSRGQLSDQEKKYPLELVFCEECKLVQILETVNPEILFCDDYPYYSSFSDALLAHSRDNALDLIERRNLDEGSLVVEIASNDGYLLKNFVEKGIGVLGIDPADGPAKEAMKIGVDTMVDFFSEELAQRLVRDGKRADVIIGNNVLAHVADLNGFVDGIRSLLKDDGVVVIEVPYVRDLIDHCEFDTIYHEHLCYFSVTSLDKLFRRHGLYLNDIKRLSIHGGSLRLYVEKVDDQGDEVKAILNEESQNGVDDYLYYQNFSEKVLMIRDSMRQLLAELKDSGGSIAAYGAAAKGTIMLNYIGVSEKLVHFVVDRNVHKHGKFVPGVRIEICEPERLIRDMPDYVILLPWNFQDEILLQQKSYRQNGGKFIVPIPVPAIV